MVLITLAIAPGLFWLWYFLQRDRLRPEPRHLIQRVFALGAVAGIAAALLEYAILSGPVLALEDGRHRSIVTTAALIGVIEEGMKFAAVFFGVYRHAEFDEVVDGIIYAVAAAMGFATLENIAYVLSGGVTVAVLRAGLSVPGHAFFGALMGFNMGMARFAGAAETRWLVSGVALAAVAHAAFDAVLLTQTWIALAVFPLVVYLWRRAVYQVGVALSHDDRRMRRGGTEDPDGPRTGPDDPPDDRRPG
ncbi:MAG: PrsW family intramembrane metalloprotease [Armatimonadetes bacterium]|nr:PrsW family intramembrane metalloprotease [Armatimonadota bacterium]